MFITFAIDFRKIKLVIVHLKLLASDWIGVEFT